MLKKPPNTRHTSKKRVLGTFVQASAGAMLSEVTKDEVWLPRAKVATSQRPPNHPKYLNGGEFSKGNGWKWGNPRRFFLGKKPRWRWNIVPFGQIYALMYHWCLYISNILDINELNELQAFLLQNVDFEKVNLLKSHPKWTIKERCM